jgi:transcriptional/translational regulatory protein YebC/TACO1
MRVLFRDILKWGELKQIGDCSFVELQLIDVGADDFECSGDHVRVVSDGHTWTKVRDFLKTQECEIESAGLQYIAKQTAPVDAQTLEKVQAISDALEEDDDVSEVHTNAVHAEEI